MFGERSLNERHNLAKLRTHGGVIFTDVREIASGIVLLEKLGGQTVRQIEEAEEIGRVRRRVPPSTFRSCVRLSVHPFAMR